MARYMWHGPSPGVHGLNLVESPFASKKTSIQETGLIQIGGFLETDSLALSCNEVSTMLDERTGTE